MATISILWSANRWLLGICLCSLLLNPIPADEQTAGDQTVVRPIRFSQQIRPILNSHCTACHGGVKQAAEISFVYRNQVLPPNGWVIDPGDPDASLLVERILSDDPSEVMPPPEHGPKLSDEDATLIQEWIRQGAIWDEHWSFQLPQKHEPIALKNPSWSNQRIDDFVLARLESQNIDPATDEDPSRWLRKVTLDLTGLPPTLKQRSDFLKQQRQVGEAAYQDVVQRLLQSPAFGERWASVWLDQVRYADSKGLGVDGRRNVWKYRDWVVNAFNQGMPYDEFTIKQIAGDLLPNRTSADLIATAAQRLSQSNEEGGTDDEEFRVAAVLDRVSTTWQTWQGITFGCTQCHSHPYDAFKHTDYYRFAAFYNNTADSDLDQEWPVFQAPINESDSPAADQLDRQIKAVRDQIWQTEFDLLSNTSAWKALQILEAKTNNATALKVSQVDGAAEFHTIGTVSRNTSIVLTAPIPESVQQLTAIRLTAKPLNPATALPDSEWGFVLSNIKAQLIVPTDDKPRQIKLSRLLIDDPDPFYDPQQSLNPKSNQGFAAFSRIHHPRQAALVLQQPTQIPAGSKLRVELDNKVFLLAAFPLVLRRGQLALSDDPRFTEVATGSELAKRREQLAELKKLRSKIPSTSIPILQERPDHLARQQHLFVRGLFLTKGQLVQPGVPESMAPLDPNQPANRLAMARWMVGDTNPLTARVAVNRFWARLFGTGLVATEEDFGSSGEPPSHPKLLDDLAWRFQHEMKWDIKALLKELALSKTYRQSSKIRPELIQSDPANRLLARGPRARLSAEIVRDQALAVSGLLNHKQAGPPVHPPIPGGVWRPFAANDKWNTPKAGNTERYRRSIYTYTKRSIPYPMFAAFDAPSREFCTPRRLPSNTPLQALMTLNDATFDECAAALADDMRQHPGSDLAAQIRYGFLKAVCRPIRDNELQQLVSLCDANNPSVAATNLKMVAMVILNLDEFLTK
ncbi:MAG: PSD1 and planctomycete cytochrome C domain-containing protein [Fuerstiella sp.]